MITVDTTHERVEARQAGLQAFVMPQALVPVTDPRWVMIRQRVGRALIRPDPRVQGHHPEAPVANG